MSSTPPSSVRAANKRQLLTNREAVARKEDRKERQRNAEKEVDELPEELKCTFMYELSGDEFKCQERATTACNRCGDILCIAHVRSSVTTLVAKPVVRPGRKEPATAHHADFCVKCSVDENENTRGVTNVHFNDPCAYT